MMGTPHVVELNMLMRTKQRVTRRTILAIQKQFFDLLDKAKSGQDDKIHLAGTMSGGTKKETQDIVTNLSFHKIILVVIIAICGFGSIHISRTPWSQTKILVTHKDPFLQDIVLYHMGLQYHIS